MIIGSLFALALVAQQVPPAPPGPANETIRLEDVVVDARRLEAAAEAYVDLIAAPARRRGLARWHDGVCVGVALSRGVVDAEHATLRPIRTFHGDLRQDQRRGGQLLLPPRRLVLDAPLGQAQHELCAVRSGLRRAGVSIARLALDQHVFQARVGRPAAAVVERQRSLE